MKTLQDVETQLYELSNQYVDKPDNVFAQMGSIVNRHREDLELLNQTLTVPAAEYVPAIQDAFTILDRMLEHTHDREGEQDVGTMVDGKAHERGEGL